MRRPHQCTSPVLKASVLAGLGGALCYSPHPQQASPPGAAFAPAPQPRKRGPRRALHAHRPQRTASQQPPRTRKPAARRPPAAPAPRRELQGERQAPTTCSHNHTADPARRNAEPHSQLGISARTGSPTLWTHPPLAPAAPAGSCAVPPGWLPGAPLAPRQHQRRRAASGGGRRQPRPSARPRGRVPRPRETLRVPRQTAGRGPGAADQIRVPCKQQCPAAAPANPNTHRLRSLASSSIRLRRPQPPTHTDFGLLQAAVSGCGDHKPPPHTDTAAGRAPPPGSAVRSAAAPACLLCPPRSHPGRRAQGSAVRWRPARLPHLHPHVQLVLARLRRHQAPFQVGRQACGRD